MDLETIKSKYYEQNSAMEKEYVTEKQNKQLNRKFEKDGNLLEDTFEGYFYERGEEDFDFYQKKYPNLSNTELEQIVNLQNNMYIKKASKDIHSMKNILVFYFMLTIINLIISFIVIFKTI